MRKLCNGVFSRQLLLAGALALAASVASAQRAGDQGEEEERETRQTPAMSERVYQRLAEAQECAEADDMECAEELLQEVREMSNLNSYERAQMWNFYAFIHFAQDNYEEAIRAYENVLEQEDLPLGLQTDTMLALAQLYMQQERWQDSLDMLDRWFEFAENPGPQPFVYQAQAHYQLQQYEQGIDPILTAIDIAQQRGNEVDESWYQLLNVFYFELENYPKVIETLTILAENWPKKDYVVQLAGMYGQEGDEDTQLALYEVAYEAGWLTRGQERVNLAQMLMQADIPYKAARLMQEGLEDGTIESTESNWRLLSQAWQLAKEDEQAIPALRRAAELSDDGELDVRLAQSHANLAQWSECAEAARSGLDRGGLDRRDQAQLLLGNCLAEMNAYEQARVAFEAAAQDDRARDAAEQWIDYIESEQERQRQIEEALRRG